MIERKLKANYHDLVGGFLKKRQFLKLSSRQI